MLEKIVNSLKHKFHFCSHAGCWKHGEDVIECYLPDYEVDEEGFRTNDEPDYYYCWEHADTHGFCKMCGEFWAGIESFEFIHPGFCDNCDDEMERDFDRGFDDEDYFDDYDDAEQGLHPTSGILPDLQAVSTPQPLVSSQAESTPPTCG